AAPLTLSAGAALVFVTALVVSVRQRRRDHAIDLILDGHESLPIAVVAEQCSRLASTRTRRALACRYVEMVDLATHHHRPLPAGAVPLYHLPVVVKATAELLEIVRLLQSPQVPIRGVARAERVIANAASPLYGWDSRALRAELRQVADLLRK